MTEAPPSNSETWVGRMLRGKYRVGPKLGSGGWGVVHEAEHVRLERPVAIKFLHSEIATDDEGRERFRREALAASRIGHPNIVSVLDLDVTDDGIDFMVLERLHGQSLGELLDVRDRLSPVRAIGIFKQVVSAVGAAHGAGIVHRDLKPDNVFLVDGAGKHDFVKILDFGIAKVSPLYPNDQGSFTHVGAMLGTPSYMPPEQVRGERTLDHRADIYALGVMMYETIAGVLPFEAENFPLLVMKIVDQMPTPLRERRPDVPAALSDLVQAMLAKKPHDRPATARAVLGVLEGLDLSPRPTDDDEVTRIAYRPGSEAPPVSKLGKPAPAARLDDSVTVMMNLAAIDAHAATRIDARTRALRADGARAAPVATEPEPSNDPPSIIISLEAFETEALAASPTVVRPVREAEQTLPVGSSAESESKRARDSTLHPDRTRALRRRRSRTRHGLRRRLDPNDEADSWTRFLLRRWASFVRARGVMGSNSSPRISPAIAVIITTVALVCLWAVVRFAAN